eukprot:2426277-Pyramimonas_sp.AAC.1
MAPRGAPGLRKLQESPKRVPKGPQKAPTSLPTQERSQIAQHDLQDGSHSPDWLKMVLNMLQTAPKPLQERLRALQDSPKKRCAGS